MNQNTRESILIVNNTEWIWLAVKDIDTITELSEFFRVYITPQVRRDLDPDTYNLRDIELGYFLEFVETKIGV